MDVHEGLDVGGFKFHHSDRGIDTGNILVQATIPISGRVMMDIIELELVGGGQRIGVVTAVVRAREFNSTSGPRGRLSVLIA